MEPRMAPSQPNVFLFVPNLIGYARVILMFIAFYYMRNPELYTITVACYLLSQLLDAFDGHAARLLGQSSKFGGMLDMLTDRCSTLGLVMALGVLYPDFFLFFQCYAVLDIWSHWIHLTASHYAGATSHKQIDLTENPILYYYYTNRTVLFGMCAGNELFFAALYLLRFSEGPDVGGYALFRSTALLCAPIMVIKSVISVVQLVAASRNIVIVDSEEHAKARS
eukprot:sb/3469727/